MARVHKSVVTFPAGSEPRHAFPREDAEAHRSYLEYILDLADRLLARRVDDDGSEAA
jgi:hypothetical protein